MSSTTTTTRTQPATAAVTEPVTAAATEPVPPAGSTSTTAPAVEDPEVLELDAEERELVGHDLDALLPTLAGDRRERYVALHAAVESGRVALPLVPALESLLELTLQTGRARTRYRADGEQRLTALYARTPGGRDLAAHLRRVGQALTSLQGQTIESLAVRMRTVGHFTLSIQTDETTITLVSRPDTIDVESIAVSS